MKYEVQKTDTYIDKVIELDKNKVSDEIIENLKDLIKDYNDITLKDSSFWKEIKNIISDSFKFTKIFEYDIGMIKRGYESYYCRIYFNNDHESSYYFDVRFHK